MLEQVQELAEYPIRAIPDRKISLKACEHYGVRVALDTANAETITSHYYPYYRGNELDAFNVRICDPKRFFGVGNRKGCAPFGWQARIGTKALYITEGELDALSLYDILRNSAEEWARKNGKDWNDRFVPDIVSIPTGASSAGRVLSEYADEIERTYKEVRLVFDNDDAGKKAVRDSIKALGGRGFKLFTGVLPKKDINECLMAGLARDVINSVVYNASEKISGRVIRSNELWNQAMERPVQGAPWAWQGLSDLTRGKRRGEVIYFGAGVS